MKIHMIGIGGAAAAYLVDLALREKYQISGSDSSLSSNIKRLTQQQIPVSVPHNPSMIEASIDEVWYSAAIGQHSPGYSELERARELGIPHLTFANAAARFFNRAETRIAVGGTHGKSTTTAMIGWILEDAGYNPTVAVGARFRPWSGNARLGSDKVFVMEADEYAKRFLELRPSHLVVTSIDPDHFDTYPTESDLINGFSQFIEFGENVVVANGQSVRVRQATAEYRGKIIYFGLGPANDLNVWIEIHGEDKILIMPANIPINLRLPGKHNLMNALAAITLCVRLGVSYEVGAHALASFPGVERRFEYTGRLGLHQLIYDDYGHHPAEIEVTLQTAREQYPNHRLILVYEPHQAGRLNNLMTETALALTKADEVVLLPVYVVIGREIERDIEDATSNKLAELVVAKGGRVHISNDYNYACDQVKKILSEKCIIITMGATDVWKVGKLLLRKT